jgi:predicted Zn finger-like uncharacterized protein
MESFGNSNDKSGRGDFSSSAPHIIIECPSCSTRFSVESTAVAAIEEPRFHCSRCDSVFSLETLPASEDKSAEPNPTDLLEQQKTPQPTKPDFVAAQSSPRQARGALPRSIPTPIKQSDFSLNYDGPSDPTTENSEDSVHDLLGSDDRGSSSATLEAHEEFSAETSDDEQPPYLRESLSLLQQSTHENATRQASAVTQALLPFDGLLKYEPMEAISDMNTQSVSDTSAEPTLHKSFERNSQEDHDDFDLKYTVPVALSRTYTLALLSLPLVAGLALLTIFSYSLRLSPQGLGAFVSGVMPLLGVQSLQLPPAELAVSKSSIRFVRLQSKEVIPVVSGTLSNRSQNSLDGITLEVLGFDGRGELLVSSQAPLRSALAREKISELPLETLRKYQTALGARRSAINAGEDVPFSVALIADGSREGQVSLADMDLSQLRYYSARVFSVTEAAGR